MNICLIKLSAIGDVVHTLPSLAALRKMYPDAHLTWVIEEEAADLIAGHPFLDRIIISRRKTWLRNLSLPQTRREMKAFISSLRDRRYDLTIDFHGLFKSAVIAAFSRSQRKIGFRSMQELSGLFYTERITEDMGKHAVDRYLDFIRYLGWENPPVEFIIPAPVEVKESASAILQSAGIMGANAFIAVNPVALWPTKLWREERFARLADMIMDILGLPVVFTGSKREEAYIKRIENAMKGKPINLAGQTTLRELAEIYRHALLVVTTDSGPMHIAAAVGTPTVALFGPTDPKRTGPYGPGHRVLRSPISCSPCLLKNCPHHQCMADIEVEDVFSHVEEVFNERKEVLKWR
ncbi:MAG TPA: lipopolysaccharide heptosyltransferase II [Syntrophales bacterium]|nr:lipopolysaccharide heptosyltransferase II [Syntrophales bacterium]HOL59346.1 lipopolysaccharide heptosyltransferase II [Syntrophales bacterium]HPO35462.1 lipopolysaccharide heptosyltransferase II [Syntrophales bacterium]